MLDKRRNKQLTKSLPSATYYSTQGRNGAKNGDAQKNWITRNNSLIKP